MGEDTEYLDRHSIKVAAVWFLDLSHAVASCHYLYTTTISQYGHPELLLVPPLSFDFIILINGLIGALEETWFIRRLYTFSKNVWISGLCGVLAFARFSFTMTITIISFQLLPLPVFIENWWWLTAGTVIIGAITDVSIVSSLCHYLWRWRRAECRRITKLIDRVILCAIETSFFTSLVAVLLLVCFLTMPTNFIWIGIYMLLPRVFANSLLFSLNFRESLSQAFGATLSNPEAGLTRRNSLYGIDSQPVVMNDIW
ncbi:hypothetical protein E1B28_012418 [Marasmius oreades]|uniref:DUF6534 domain-containing protein n=1 Tax=Marasmius oreades TaxID=181124 RepID=A0A9P7RRH9_9AGAR|nr:uncharacterized protein E1B28_012418 [Marasmius oreades]KAG7088424.1 hypothetical protein E1B28_012418 [Marasmius oreades]